MNTTPGQAAYEAWMALSGDEDPYGWSYKHEPFRIHWEGVAQAAIEAWLRNRHEQIAEWRAEVGKP